MKSQELVSRDAKTIDNVPVEKHVTIPPVNQWTPSPSYYQPLFTSSSEGQASLQEIWKMLDAEESFQSPTPRKTRPSSPQRQVVARDLEPDHNPARDWPERDVFALTGRRTEAKSRPTKHRPELSNKAGGKAKLTPKKQETPQGHWTPLFFSSSQGAKYVTVTQHTSPRHVNFKVCDLSYL